MSCHSFTLSGRVTDRCAFNEFLLSLILYRLSIFSVETCLFTLCMTPPPPQYITTRHGVSTTTTATAPPHADRIALLRIKPRPYHLVFFGSAHVIRMTTKFSKKNTHNTVRSSNLQFSSIGEALLDIWSMLCMLLACRDDAFGSIIRSTDQSWYVPLGAFYNYSGVVRVLMRCWLVCIAIRSDSITGPESIDDSMLRGQTAGYPERTDQYRTGQQCCCCRCLRYVRTAPRRTAPHRALSVSCD